MGKLTARSVASLSTKSRHADGDGLYLLVDSHGRKYWQLRYMLGGRRRDMSIGPVRSHTLAAAREIAREARGKLARGVDPMDDRLITANQPFGERGKVFPDPAMTLAAVDRLVHHATIFEMNVDSFRRRAALERKQHDSGRPANYATIKNIEAVSRGDNQSET